MGGCLPRVVIVLMLVGMCRGHGRLVNPASRASAWRYGFKTPVNYNDNESNCGGFARQWLRNDGKCGVCGDAWDIRPRPHEIGGKYATGTIVANYTEGNTIQVDVEITANHLGKMEFKICPARKINKRVTQQCLDKYPLLLTSGSKFYDVGRRRGRHTVHLKLPQKLNCERCVLQWRYIAGNNWGYCEDGSSGLGCGPQEEFRACADVAIRPGKRNDHNNSEEDDENDITTTPTPTTTTQVSKTTKKTKSKPPNSTTASTVPKRTTTISFHQTTIKKQTLTWQQKIPFHTPKKTICGASGVWKSVSHMDQWCQTNCNHVPSFCPASHCSCS